MGQPNELPEGGEGGGGFGGWGGIRGEWPAELPVGPDFGSLQAILVELSRLQVRLQTLEAAQLQAKVLGAGAVGRAMYYLPNELPEGGEGGGGGGVHIPRGEWPQEMPTIYREVLSQVVERLTSLEATVASQLGEINAKLGAGGVG